MTNSFLLEFELPELALDLDDREPFEDTDRTGEANYANMVHSFAGKGHLNFSYVFRLLICSVQSF